MKHKGSKSGNNLEMEDETTWMERQKKRLTRVTIAHLLLVIFVLIEIILDHINVTHLIITYSKQLFVHQYLITIIKHLNCLRSTINADQIRSSLLVIWTFLSVMVMYFAEHKNEKHYGQSIGEIIYVIFGNKLMKLFFCSLAELTVLLLSIIIKIPISMVVLSIVLIVTVFTTIKFIILDTSSDDIVLLFNRTFKKTIQSDWAVKQNLSNNTYYQNTKTKDKNSSKQFAGTFPPWANQQFLYHFSSMVQNMNPNWSTDYDFLLYIFPKTLCAIMEEDTSCVFWDMPYEAVHILLKSVDPVIRRRLEHDLIRKILEMENEHQSSPFGNRTLSLNRRGEDALSVLLMYPIKYLNKDEIENPYSEFLDMLNSTGSGKTSAFGIKMVFYALIHNEYSKDTLFSRQLLSEELIRMLPENRVLPDSLKESLSWYWWNIMPLYPGNISDSSWLYQLLDIE